MSNSRNCTSTVKIDKKLRVVGEKDTCNCSQYENARYS